MQNLTRSKSMNFRVTPEEYTLIKRRQAQTGIINTRAYLLKQAIDGRVIRVELDSVKECTRQLSKISDNIDQIVYRAYQGGINSTDLENIRVQQDEIWAVHREVLKTLSKILGAI